MGKLKEQLFSLQRLVGPLVWSGGMVVAAFVATSVGILAAHALHTRLVRDPIQWLESHPGVASWVQAVGSVLAILVAAAIASWQMNQTRSAERETQRKNFRGKMSAVEILMSNALYQLQLSKADLDNGNAVNLSAIEDIGRLCERIDSLPMFEFPAPAAMDVLNMVSGSLRYVKMNNQNVTKKLAGALANSLTTVDWLIQEIEDFRVEFDKTFLKASKPGEPLPERLRKK